MPNYNENKIRPNLVAMPICCLLFYRTKHDADKQVILLCSNCLQALHLTAILFLLQPTTSSTLIFLLNFGFSAFLFTNGGCSCLILLISGYKGSIGMSIIL